MDKKLNIVITGVSRGLGKAMTEGFAAEGHTVIGCARNKELLESFSAKLDVAHRFDVVDVSSSQQVNDWASCIVSEFGSPDFLINSAAIINQNAPLWEVSEKEFSQVVDINIKGVFNTIRGFVPAMIERRRGVIVNFSSYWGRSTAADVAAYCATKWAIEGLSGGLANDLPSGMASIALNLGVIHTEMLESCFGDAAASYPNAKTWAKTAVPFILNMTDVDNGSSVTVPVF